MRERALTRIVIADQRRTPPTASSSMLHREKAVLIGLLPCPDSLRSLPTQEHAEAASAPAAAPFAGGFCNAALDDAALGDADGSVAAVLVSSAAFGASPNGFGAVSGALI